MSQNNINNFSNQLRINQLDNTTTDVNNVDKRTEDFLDKLNKIYERCIPLELQERITFSTVLNISEMI